METSSESEGRTLVVMDASSIIDLIEAGLLEVVLALPSYRFGLPRESLAEITRSFQRARVEAAVEHSTLALFIMDDPEEIARKEEFTRYFGAGEAACLAMAITRGWYLACEERNRRFLKEIKHYSLEARILRVEDLLAIVVREGRKSIEEVTAAIREAAATCLTNGERQKSAHLETILARLHALLNPAGAGE